MTIQFGSASFNFVIDGSENSTIVGTPPPEIQIGDVMLAYLSGWDNSDPGSGSAPSGWTVAASNYETTGLYKSRQLLAWKVYSGDETNEDFTFGVTAHAYDDALVIQRIYGDLDTSNLISIVSDFVGGSSSDKIAPGVTTESTNSTVMYFVSARNGASENADDTGQPIGTEILYNRRSRARSSAIRVASAYEVVANAGDTGDKTWIAFTTSGDYGSSVTLVINERPGPAPDPEPKIDPSGTDTTLVNGSSQQVSFTGLTATPTSVSLAYGGKVFEQPNFSIGAVTEGVATANFTAAIGNLPYTSTTYPASGFSYLVTCDDESELTLSGITILPATNRSFVTAVNPVEGSTSIISDWIEGLAQKGDQIDYPKQVENVTLTVNPDFTHTGIVPEGEEFPSSISFGVNYWDSVSGERYPVTVEISFKENNSEILEFVPSSADAIETTFIGVRNFSVNELVPATTDGVVVSFTGAEESFISEFVPSSSDAISIEFFASSKGFINELVPATTDSIGGVFNGLSNVIVNELVPSSTDIIVSTFEKINFSNIIEFVPSSTDSVNVTFDQPVRINEQVPASKDSIIIFYGEKLFTPSLSRTLYIKP